MKQHPAHCDGQRRGQSRAADAVFRALAGRISSGDLAHGDLLPPEREIIKMHGVSRTVAREAVQALASKGLVEAKPRCRPVVREPGFETAFNVIETVVNRLLREPQEVRNLFDARVMIEAALARQAAKAADKRHIAAMKTALEANRAAVADSRLFDRTDVDFHAALYRVPENPLFPAIHKAFTAWLLPHWSEMPRRPESNAVNFEFHQRIFEAILMRDPDAAEDALERHLAYAWDQVRLNFAKH